MISGIDIRDFEQLDVEGAKKALKNMDNYTSRNVPFSPCPPHKILEDFINSVSKMQKRTHKVAALFRPLVDQEYNGKNQK